MKKSTCCNCGRVFHAHRKLKYCELCKFLKNKNVSNVSAISRDCETCGKAFIPSNRNWQAECCSKSCRDKKKIYYGRCEYCKKTIHAPYQSRKQKYCSITCGIRSRYPLQQVFYRLHKRFCRICNISFWTRIERSRCDECRKAGFQVRPLEWRKCGWCNIPFKEKPSKGLRSIFCNDLCRRAKKRKINRISNKKHGAGNHRRRARKHGVQYTPIDPLVVFHRDKWTCQLCGCSTPPEIRGTLKDNAPELDHIIPLSLGGPHIESNVQCACRVCNMLKGNKLNEEYIQWNHSVTRGVDEFLSNSLPDRRPKRFLTSAKFRFKNGKTRTAA